MTTPIGDSASSARSAIESALKRHADSLARLRSSETQTAPEVAKTGGFGEALEKGLDKMDASVRGSDNVVDEFVTGKIGDFHEVALRLKESELSFRFAMEVRNKFIDAYREVMRMSV